MRAKTISKLKAIFIRKFDKSSTIISRWENNKPQPLLKTLDEITIYLLNVDVKYLLVSTNKE
jgi:transcriptional regulator with XRE-family HTH domain